MNVGTAPLRRLTREEYEHVVSDVFGVSDAASGLAVDERIDGVFASNSTSAVVPVQVRQYLDAAEAIAARVNVLDLVDCDRGKSGDDGCAQQMIQVIGRRAYRRPLRTDEVDRLRTLYSMEAKAEGHSAGLRLVVQSMLQSPNFLYHVELVDSATDRSKGSVAVDPYALASRLSFFLWSSGPDDTLLDAVREGELKSAASLAAQVARMIDDPRASRGIASFHSQWLGLTKLETASRDVAIFPEWTPELVAAIRTESARFSDHVVRKQSASLTTLLTAPYSFPVGPGRAIRGIDGPDSDEPVMLEPGKAQGLLTQPAFLASFAHTNQTSPILRGRAVRERFFCQPLPDPPPNVAAVAPALADDLTTRERYAMHRTANTACFSCHRLIDDLGFALEHYDALGRYRERENGKPIDSSGQLIETDIDGPIDSAMALANRMSSSELASTCYATQWFRYALGRSEAPADRCSLKHLTDGFSGESKIRDLLIAIATSDAFTRQRVEE